MGLRSWLWRALGGATDADGRAIAYPDDWVAVFEGRTDDFERMRHALGAAGFEVRADVLVLDTEATTTMTAAALGAAGPDGVPREPTGILSVRAADAEAAAQLVARYPHLGHGLHRG